jgi:hypothetical protein
MDTFWKLDGFRLGRQHSDSHGRPREPLSTHGEGDDDNTTDSTRLLRAPPARIAAYTSSRDISRLVPGTRLRGKDPRYHTFMEGTGDARIQDEYLKTNEVLKMGNVEYVES